jgi:beta-phosphoglucomutase-like phosphatase (HAD superfamily)
MTDTTPTPARLWKRMSAEQRLRAAQALHRDPDARNDQRQAAMLVAKQMKFRPKTVLGLDDDRKARYLAGVADLPEDLAARMLIVYHLAEQRPMMSAFLDALGIAHDNGLIHDDAVAPDPAKIATATATIAAAYPADDVALYLDTLRSQDPGTWGGL